MEQINPYAVMRNTATYEAYRAHCRGAWKAGQGLMLVGMLLPGLWAPTQMVIGRRLLHPGTMDAPLYLALLIAPAIVGALLVAVGGLKLARYRREHPIPEAWLQFSRRSSRLPVPAQRPRLRGRG